MRGKSAKPSLKAARWIMDVSKLSSKFHRS